MQKIKLEELIFVARKEKEYLNLAITQLENILNDTDAIEIPASENLILRKLLLDIKLFYDNFSASWSDIYKEYTLFTTEGSNLKDSKKFTEFIFTIQKQVQQLRSDFAEKHKYLVNELDQSFIRNLASEVHPEIYLAFSAAHSYLLDTENANNNINNEKLNSLMQLMNYYYQPISHYLHEIDPYANSTFKQPLYPLLPQNMWREELKKFLTLYNNRLMDFLKFTRLKFEFFYQHKTFTDHCNEVYQITIKPQHYVNVSAPDDFHQPDTDFLYVLNFIKNNADFFCEPFVHPDAFKAWANKNITDVTPISKLLKENLKYSDQMTAFVHALKAYIHNDKDGLLCRFLLHKTNMLTFVVDLKMMLVKGMYLEKNLNKSPRYTTLTLSLEKVCEKWRKDKVIYDFNKKAAFLFWASRHDKSSTVFNKIDKDCMTHLHQSFIKSI